MNAELIRARAAIGYLASLPGQDAMLVVEMAETMLEDIILNGELGDMLGYVKRYCDVVDGPDQARLVVLGITESLETPEPPGGIDLDTGRSPQDDWLG